jgi:hypothetical protein
VNIHIGHGVVTPCSIVFGYQHLWRKLLLLSSESNEDGDSRFLSNIAVHLLGYMVSQLREDINVNNLFFCGILCLKTCVRMKFGHKSVGSVFDMPVI